MASYIVAMFPVPWRCTLTTLPPPPPPRPAVAARRRVQLGRPHHAQTTVGLSVSVSVNVEETVWVRSRTTPVTVLTRVRPCEKKTRGLFRFLTGEIAHETVFCFGRPDSEVSWGGEPRRRCPPRACTTSS